MLEFVHAKGSRCVNIMEVDPENHKYNCPSSNGYVKMRRLTSDVDLHSSTDTAHALLRKGLS